MLNCNYFVVVPLTNGKCHICDEIFSSLEMGRHLIKCIALEYRENQAFLIKITSEDSKFWMFIKVSPDCTLDSIDNFLRDIWLEIHDHMSHFIIENICYEKIQVDGLTDMENYKSMQILARDIFHHKLRFSYEYDYGDTTLLHLEIHSIINDDDTSLKPVLVARNNSAKIVCDSCQVTASMVCEMCMCGDDDGFFCENCAKKHQCKDCDDEPLFLPVVNSPRWGYALMKAS